MVLISDCSFFHFHLKRSVAKKKCKFVIKFTDWSVKQKIWFNMGCKFVSSVVFLLGGNQNFQEHIRTVKDQTSPSPLTLPVIINRSITAPNKFAIPCDPARNRTQDSITATHFLVYVRDIYYLPNTRRIPVSQQLTTTLFSCSLNSMGGGGSAQGSTAVIKL